MKKIRFEVYIRASLRAAYFYVYTSKKFETQRYGIQIVHDTAKIVARFVANSATRNGRAPASPAFDGIALVCPKWLAVTQRVGPTELARCIFFAVKMYVNKSRTKAHMSPGKRTALAVAR